jgi:DNA polymerase-3 subunit alpha
MLTNIKKHIDKNGNTMAFISMEDISAQAEGVVFASNYEVGSKNLREDIPVIIWGKADNKDDKSQIIINSIEVVEQVKMVMINLSAEEVSNPTVQNKLKSILEEQSGDKKKAKVPIIGIINSIKERIFIRFGENFWVQNEANTVEALKNAGFNAYSQFVKQS